jgi:hypothetical protein
LLSFLTSLRSAFVDSFGTCTQTVTSPVTETVSFLLCNLDDLYFLSLCYCTSQDFQYYTWEKKVVRGGTLDLCLLLDLNRKTYGFSSLTMMLTLVLCRYSSSSWRSPLFQVYGVFKKFTKGCWILSNAFSACIDRTMWFFIISLLIKYINLFFHVESTLHKWNNWMPYNYGIWFSLYIIGLNWLVFWGVFPSMFMN